MSFLYRGGKLPFCLGRFPYFNRSRAFSTQLVPYGEGTKYPLTLTIEQFAACYWRVKKWQFSGSIDAFFEEDESTFSFETSFSFTFTRTFKGFGYLGGYDPPLREKDLICRENKQTHSIWPEAPNEEDVEFTGTLTTPEETETVDLLLSLDLGYRNQSNNLVQVALRPEGTLQCYFDVEFFIGGSGYGVLITNDEAGRPAGAPPFVGTMDVCLPSMEPIELSLFGGEGGDVNLEDWKIEPIEFYTWGGLYNPETGDPVV